jgi:protein-disulfide isomerase/uncharacterized membrane protein
MSDPQAGLPAETVAYTSPEPPGPQSSVPRWRLLLVEAVAIAGAAISGLLLLQHHGDVYATAAVNQVCGDTAATATGAAAAADSGCEAVARSAYSEYNGIPIAAIGLLFYFSLALLLMFAVLFRELADAGAFLALAALALALVVDLMLFGVQAIAINAFCKLCLLTYLLNLIGLVLLLPVWRDYRAPLRALSASGGRAGLAAWAISSFTFALTVVALDWALGMSGEQRQVNAILGSPAPAATPASVSSTPSPSDSDLAQATPSPAANAASSNAQDPQQGELSAQLDASRAEARRLQGILDDPKKLEQFFTDKAMREFETGVAQDLPLAGTPYKGPENAAIRVVEFSDFLCPFCRQIAGAFANYVPRAGNRVAVYFKNYPLEQACNANLGSTVHPGACTLALGAICAQEQDRFWPYHDKVFGSQLNNPQPKDVVGLAGSAGLDTGAFETCLGSQKAKDRLAAEIQEGLRGGVTATPTLFINGKRLPRVNDFLAAIEKESARLGLPPLPQPSHSAH